MTGAIIQARMGSTRLPQKVIQDLGGKKAIEHILDRLKKAKTIEKIVLAIPDSESNDILENIAKENNVLCYRGSESNVLERYYKVALEFKIDPVVRITGDCPFLDHKVIDKVVEMYLQGDYDYVSNVFPPTYPDGLDVEVLGFDVLEKVYNKAETFLEKEHPTLYIENHFNEFKTGNVENDKDYSYLRLTLDEKDDLELLRKVSLRLGNDFGLEEIINLFEKEPDLKKINQSFERNEGYAIDKQKHEQGN